MKQSIQDKIDHLNELARQNRNVKSNASTLSSNREDSLAKSIRNKKDAMMFMADLETAFRLSLNKESFD